MDVHKNNKGQVETDVHRKPIQTEKYPFFYSYHPRSYKKSVGRTFFQRAEPLASNRAARNNERDYVLNVLKGCIYQRNFLYARLKFPFSTECNSAEGVSSNAGVAKPMKVITF